MKEFALDFVEWKDKKLLKDYIKKKGWRGGFLSNIKENNGGKKE